MKTSVWLLAILFAGCGGSDVDSGGGELDAGAPGALSAVSAIDFDEVSVGTQKTATMILENPGPGDLHLYEIQLDDDAGFALGTPSSVLIAPGEDGEISVVFTPERVGAASAWLAIDTNSGDAPRVEIELLGVGAGAALSIAPTTEADGALYAERSEDDRVRLQSVGTEELAIYELDAVDIGECNEGFYREEEALALVSVSDEPEQSPSSWSDYVSSFQSMKPDAEQVVVHAIAGDIPGGCGSAEPGTGHYEATVATDGVFLSICANDFGEHLRAIAEGSAWENRIFRLSERPIGETVSVSVAGVEVDGWSYVEDGNYVLLDDGTAPAAGAEVLVDYQTRRGLPVATACTVSRPSAG